MCIIAAGTSAQPLVATLFQLAFLLVVLKLAPYDGDTDDQASFIAALTLTLTMLCGFALMMDNPLDPNFDPSIAGGVMMFISIGCLVMSLGGVVKEKCKGRCKRAPGAVAVVGKKAKEKNTKVIPSSSRAASSRVENEQKRDEMKRIRLEYGASSKEYKAAAEISCGR